MTQRARKGGQIGANGEYYKGGQFIATTDNPKQATITTKARLKKYEIAPYQWVSMSFDEYKKYIYRLFKDFIPVKETSFKSGVWKVERSKVSAPMIDYLGLSREEFDLLADRFDAGILTIADI